MGTGNGLRFGCASAVITPPMGVSMAGYFTDRKAEGVCDDLYAKVLVLGRGGREIMFIACDLVGMPAEFSLPLRAAVSERTGIPLESIMAAATHTHTGPVVSGVRADERYLASASGKIVEAAAAAHADMKECRAEFGSEELRGYAFNRRYFMKDGSVLTNPGGDNPEVAGPAGPVDYSLNVMKFSGISGKPEAVLVNCALHPDTIGGCMISADWPGYLSARLRERLGGQVCVLVLNGASGDINHFDVAGGRVVQNIGEARRIGFAYGDKAADICSKALPLEAGLPGSAFETVSVPAREISREDIEKAENIISSYGDEYDPEKSRRQLESQDLARGDRAVLVFFARKLLSFSEKYSGASLGIPLQAFGLGDVAVVGAGGEIFTGIGLRIKNNGIFDRTLVVELANDSQGYLPTEKSFGEGGYELMPRETSKMGPEVERLLVSSSLRLLEKLGASRD